MYSLTYSASQLLVFITKKYAWKTYTKKKISAKKETETAQPWKSQS